MEEVKLTPMMKQYQDAKAEIPGDAILLFRLGDFYEMFFDDAKRASAIAGLTYTSRGGVPMSGFPYHSLDTHLPKLLEAGVKVAIAEQMEDPRLAKGIVKRQITRIITPGTVTDSSVLSPRHNNFLTALAPGRDCFGLASLDISTGEFKVTQLKDHSAVENELLRLNTRECLVPESIMEQWNNIPPILNNDSTRILWTPLDDWIFSADAASELLKRHLQVMSLDGFGCRNLPDAVRAAGAVLHYATESLRQAATHIRKIQTYHNDQFMHLDYISQRNLELVEPMLGRKREGTLLHVLDLCLTPMGKIGRAHV